MLAWGRQAFACKPPWIESCSSGEGEGISRLIQRVIARKWVWKEAKRLPLWRR